MSSFLSRCRQRLVSPLTPIFITVFVDLFAVALVMPLMPQIRTNLGIEAHTWGLLSSWYGACQFISSLFMGRISDAYGRRLVFAISCIGAATSYQIMTHATSLWMLFVARLIVGLCKQTTSTAHALIGDWSHVSQRATMLGNVNMMIGLAMIVGSPAGGHLAHTDFYLPVKVATALFIIEMIIIVYWLPGTPPASHVVPAPALSPVTTSTRRISQPDQVNVRAVHVQSASEERTNGTPDTPRKQPSPSHPTRNGLFHTLLFYIRDPLLSKILIILILFYISTKSYRDSLLITLQTRFSLQPVDLGWISSYLGILSAAIQGFALKPMTARWDERTLTFICLGGQCIGHAICSIAPTLTIWMIFYPIIAITSGVLRTSLVGIVTKTVPRQELGTVLGMIASLGSLTYIIGPTIGGLAIRYYGVTAPHLMSFGMALIIGMYAHTYFPDLHGVNHTHGHGHEKSQEMATLIPKEMNGNVKEIDPRIKVLTPPRHESDMSLSPLSAPTITSAGLKSPRPAHPHPRLLHTNPTSHSQESPPLSPSPTPYPMLAMSP